MMGRKLQIDLRGISAGEEPVVVDSAGRPWTTAAVSEDGAVVAVELTEIPLWDLALEGVQLGTALGEDPAAAAVEALREAGVSALPEAVAVRLSPAGGASGPAVMVFTLGGTAYQLDHARFNAEIAGTTRWTAARQKHQRQIDALRDELKRIVEQR